MKKSHSSFIFFLLLSSIIFATDSFSNLSEAQTKALFCHKWKLTFLEYKGKKNEIPAKAPVSYLVFLTDGKLQEFEGAKKYDGTWSYNHSTKTIITIDQDGKENHKIILLNDTEFVMNGKYQGFVFNMGFKRAD